MRGARDPSARGRGRDPLRDVPWQRRPWRHRRTWPDPWAWGPACRLRHRWHHEHARFRHSLGARLIAVFLVLALAGSLVMGSAATSGWHLGWALPVLLGITLFAYGTVRWMLLPQLRALRRGAEAFGRGELDHRIPVWRHDELGHLALRFNHMAADIQAMLDAKRALLLAMSHELRSPLTRARLHAELVEEGESKQALLHELGQMRDLIAALLENERLGQGHAALQLERVDLAALVQRHVAEQAADALAHGALQLQLEPGLPPLQADPTRLQLLLRNLLANALRHNDATQGPVLVSLRRDGAGLRHGGAGQRLSVRDHGPGVPPGALAQLGQPFFRPDAARTRAEGGVGLGLALCSLVAQAHGSRLELRNAEPGFEASVLLGA
jgi:signal transduction histidine kinase